MSGWWLFPKLTLQSVTPDINPSFAINRFALDKHSWQNLILARVTLWWTFVVILNSQFGWAIQNVLLISSMELFSVWSYFSFYYTTSNWLNLVTLVTLFGGHINCVCVVSTVQRELLQIACTLRSGWLNFCFTSRPAFLFQRDMIHWSFMLRLLPVRTHMIGCCHENTTYADVFAAVYVYAQHAGCTWPKMVWCTYHWHSARASVRHTRRKHGFATVQCGNLCCTFLPCRYVCLVGSVCGGGEGDTSDYPTEASVCMPRLREAW